MSLAQKRMATVALGGTSLTNGRLATSWDTELKQALEQAVDRPVRVVNFGKGSQTSTSWGVPINPTIAALQPDFFVTEGYGINNCALGVSRADANSNLDTIITGMRSISPRTRICIQTMSPASAGDALRGNLPQYYGDEIAKALQWGTDYLNHYVNWPNPLPTGITQIDPSTGLPDGLHPNKAAVRQYFLPTLLNYLVPLIRTMP